MDHRLPVTHSGEAHEQTGHEAWPGRQEGTRMSDEIMDEAAQVAYGKVVGERLRSIRRQKRLSLQDVEDLRKQGRYDAAYRVMRDLVTENFLIQFLLNLLNHFLYTGRMYAPVGNQAFQRYSGNFAAKRIDCIG